MLVVVVGKANSGKSYFTNHHLFQTVPGLGGAEGTVRVFENDMLSNEQILDTLNRKENVILELQSLTNLNPVLRRNVSCYVFTSRVSRYPPEDELFNKRVKEIVDATFAASSSPNVASDIVSHPRVIYNRGKSTLVVHTVYDL